MGKIIAIANIKGGTGKTITTSGIGKRLADMGKKVLLIDLDHQGCLTRYYHRYLEPITFDRSIAAVLGEKKADIRTCVMKTQNNLDIVPSINDHGILEKEMLAQKNPENIVAQALAPVKDEYDFILIDCPPFLSMTINALSAAEGVIIPTTASFLPMRTLKNMIDAVKGVQERTNPALEVYGLVVTNFDNDSNDARERLKALKTVCRVIGVIPNDDYDGMCAAYYELAKKVESGTYE